MSDAASTLCLACGFCCDGTLFAWVKLETPEEVEALRAAGMEVGRREDGTPAVHQCCPALKGRACQVYAVRPSACRRFRCNLLIAVDEGEVDVPEALATIAKTHEAIAEVARALKREGGRDDAAAATADVPSDAAPTPTVARERVEELLKRHFLGRSTP